MAIKNQVLEVWAISRLLETDFNVNLVKTCFVENEVEFFSYVITPDGVRAADPKKLEAIHTILPTYIKSEATEEFLGHDFIIYEIRQER